MAYFVFVSLEHTLILLCFCSFMDLFILQLHEVALCGDTVFV